MSLPVANIRRRDILELLADSLQDHTTADEEVRYKMIIHSSEDDSLVRVLLQSGLLHERKARIYICSDLPGDSSLQQVCIIMLSLRS